MKKIYTLVAFLVFFYSVSLRAQVFYSEAFDSYTINQSLNGHGNLVSSKHVYVTPHGVVGNCGEFQMTDTALSKYDTITSPVIGPLTANTATSFYFRVVTYSGNTPSVYTMGAGDQVVISVGNPTLAISIPQYTINSSNQNTTTSYVKVTVPAPAFVSGISGRFRIIASNPNAHNWLFELDSLVVRDTLVTIIPPMLSDSVTNVKCRAQSNGAIKVMASGATPPYTYHWSTGGTTDTIYMRPAGVYSVTVTDSLNATAILTDTIHEPALTLIADSLSKTDVACHGQSTGTATIYVSGGTLPYHYNWSTSPMGTTFNIQNQSAGNYNVTVTDANSCSVSATAHIVQPSSALTLTVSYASSSGNCGTYTASVNGGTSPFTYQWASQCTVFSTSVVTINCPGGVILTVTDAGGCSIRDTFIACPSGIDELSNDVKLYPNPTKDMIYYQIDGLNGEVPAIACTDMMGRTWKLHAEQNNSVNVGFLAAGVYTIQFKTSSHFFAQRLVIGK